MTLAVVVLPSETYGRIGVTPIFRSFHRTASSTTGGWSRLNSFNVLLYIILSTKVSFLEEKIFFGKYTLHVCYVFNVI